MKLDLADPNILAKLVSLAGSRTKLTIIYPSGPEYRDKILGALGEVLAHREHGEPKVNPVVEKPLRLENCPWCNAPKPQGGDRRCWPYAATEAGKALRALLDEWCSRWSW